MLQNVVVDEKVLTEKIKNYTDSEIPDCCVYCSSGDIKVGQLQTSDLCRCWSLVRCQDCGAKWYENYKFTHISETL